MPSLHASGVAFAHSDAAPLFDSIDFTIPPGWTGLVGENGAGKTTLLRLLSGELTPTRGGLRVDPEGALVLTCAQEVELVPLDARALAEGELGPRSFKLMGRLGLAPEQLTRWSALSPGERKRWQIGAALAREPDVLLLDEPTNHLDAAARDWLVSELRRFRGIGVIVSHDRDVLDVLTERTLRLERQGAALYPLPYTQARALWEGARAAQLERHARVKAEEQKLTRRLDDQRRAAEASHRQRSTGTRLKDKYDSDARTLMADRKAEMAEEVHGRSVEKTRAQLARVQGQRDAIEVQKQLGGAVFAQWEPAPMTQLLALQRQELRSGGTEHGSDRVLLRELALVVRREDRIHVAGPNGSGKTTLLRALLAQSKLPPARVLWLPQELTEAEVHALLESVRALGPEQRGRVLSIVAALGVDPARLLASARPSPGEAKKLLLALGLGLQAWLLVLDEPTDHLDLPSIERLQSALEAYPGALLVVTHDDALARACTENRWTLQDGQLLVSAVECSPTPYNSAVRAR
ncbi:MAG: ABC-F family ATP-binding cassette domain-containing protein [Deltaproteobacteria bacterium]|nr:ABC-F family ATP-binding cassette domain-containing protein [Deltaproteobacteria bacterium]